MKKIIVISLICSLVLACSKNNLPTITRRHAEHSAMNNNNLESGFVPDPANGKTIFDNRCDRCHGRYEPVDYNAQQWETILSRMAPRAHLSAEQAANVLAYLKKHAGQ